MLYLFSAKQYYEPNVPVEVVTTYSNVHILTNPAYSNESSSFLSAFKKEIMKIDAVVHEKT